MQWFLLHLITLAIFPLVESHGCPAFNFSSKDTTSILQTPLVPPIFTDFVNNRTKTSTNTTSNTTATTFHGVYDCHIEQGAAEVAVSVICNDEKQDDCICEALYQFQPCQSCSVCDASAVAAATGSSSTATTTTTLNVNSFQADCTNVLMAFEDTTPSSCTVQCGFQTNGCFYESSGAAATMTFLPREVGNSMIMMILLVSVLPWWSM